MTQPSPASQSISPATPACCLCGLLCPLPMKWPDHDHPPACSRLHAWLNMQDACGAQSKTVSDEEVRQALSSAATRLRLARRPLLWLESVDVRTTRSAVQLARATGATLYVAQSPGAERTAAVAGSDGWLGTTLAEIGSTASLVIHVGEQHLRDAPMFATRFANPAAQHLFLDAPPAHLPSDTRFENEVMQLNWTKEMWLDGLSRTLLVLRDESAALARRANALDVSAGMLAEMLLGSHYTAIVWSEDELADELDSLIVRRLLELARFVTRTARCSLMSLPQDPGRVTAKDAILWLTNHTGPLRFSGDQWVKDPTHLGSLHEWEQAFDWIGCIRNLPSDRPLPELRFDMLIDAHCNVNSRSKQDRHDELPIVLPASCVGLDASGHLLRADHGLAAIVHAISSQPSPFAHAAELLQQVGALYRVTHSPALASEDR